MTPPHRNRSHARVAVLATLLCASAVTWFCAVPTYASFPGKNGALALGVIGSEDDSGICGPEELPCAFGGSRIAIFDPASRRTTRVLPTCARTPCSDTNPNWSPDGRQLVYAQAQLNTLGIINADGTGARTLTAGRIGAWSPDGRRLVIEDLPNTRSRRQLYVINADGSGRRQLTVAGGLEPAWSSTNRIVFTRYDSGRGVHSYVSFSQPAAGADWSRAPAKRPTGRPVVVALCSATATAGAGTGSTSHVRTAATNDASQLRERSRCGHPTDARSHSHERDASSWFPLRHGVLDPASSGMAMHPCPPGSRCPDRSDEREITPRSAIDPPGGDVKVSFLQPRSIRTTRALVPGHCRSRRRHRSSSVRLARLSRYRTPLLVASSLLQVTARKPSSTSAPRTPERRPTTDIERLWCRAWVPPVAPEVVATGNGRVRLIRRPA